MSGIEGTATDVMDRRAAFRSQAQAAGMVVLAPIGVVYGPALLLLAAAGPLGASTPSESGAALRAGGVALAVVSWLSLLVLHLMRRRRHPRTLLGVVLAVLSAGALLGALVLLLPAG